MRMERLENGCLKIVLSEQELADRQLSFSLMDYRNAATRQALSRLLREAESRTGFHAPGALMIEALPLSDGCLLLVTPELSRPRLRIRRSVGPLVYRVPDADSLLALAAEYGRDPLHDRSLSASSLYRENEGYRLVVYPALTFSKKTRRLLETFSSSWQEGEGAAAFAAEHGKQSIVGNALPQISEAVLRSQA